MRSSPTLRGRLVVTYLIVVGAVVGSGFIMIRLLTPVLFTDRVQARIGAASGRGAGPGGPPEQSVVTTQVQDAYDEALTIALLVALAVGMVLALVLALWFSRRVLRRLAEMRRATSRIASGDYNAEVTVPDDVELADLATSINKLGASLASTEQSRARLVSDLAHELRNPLATIEGYMEGLIDGVLPATTETYTTIAGEAHRLQRLTNDLSLLSRAQEDALELEIRPLDLTAVGRYVVERLRPQFLAKQVELVSHLEDPLPVAGDSDRLTQAITNIVGNALAHTPPGGKVTVTGRSSNRSRILEVADTGSGIAAEHLESIFHRFTRLDPDTPGTGIGLNISRTIARLHDGDLTARSDGAGTGSTFTLTIPAT